MSNVRREYNMKSGKKQQKQFLGGIHDQPLKKNFSLNQINKKKNSSQIRAKQNQSNLQLSGKKQEEESYQIKKFINNFPHNDSQSEIRQDAKGQINISKLLMNKQMKNVLNQKLQKGENPSQQEFISQFSKLEERFQIINPKLVTSKHIEFRYNIQCLFHPFYESTFYIDKVSENKKCFGLCKHCALKYIQYGFELRPINNFVNFERKLLQHENQQISRIQSKTNYFKQKLTNNKNEQLDKL